MVLPRGRCYLGGDCGPVGGVGRERGTLRSGDFTDHSSADVVPALFVGGLLLATHLVLRVRRALHLNETRDLIRSSRDALQGRIVRSLPAILAIQLVALYCMETSEQIAVIGHPLGGAVWLGGPVLMSLAARAITCALVAYTFSRVVAAFARSAVHVVLIILAMAVRAVRGVPPIELGRPATPLSTTSFSVLCNVGERAPPLLTA
jgi:hypothetical protein